MKNKFNNFYIDNEKEKEFKIEFKLLIIYNNNNITAEIEKSLSFLENISISNIYKLFYF